MEQMFTNIDLLCVINNENGQIITLDHDDVTSRVFKALKTHGNANRLLALNLADKVIYRLKNWKSNQITLCDVEYMIKFVLTELGLSDITKPIDISSQQYNQYN